ncbi:insulin-induced protein-domain-containing protein [Biscogniauxia sp. FL1348]|nr:insulin-induced protein-domain-containing protein [Biscogniauxia sp. FL1348]
MTDSPNGPPLFRPVPRRPFGPNLRDLTPPDDDNFSPSHAPQSTLNLETLNSKLLDPKGSNAFSESGSLSRAQSVRNLTSSTLMGIYSPTTYGPDRFYAPGDEPSTPWGTGAETPAGALSAEDPHYELSKERTHPMRRRSSLHPISRPPPLSNSASIFYLTLRALVLSGLGVLYGLLAAQVQDTHRAAFHMETISQATQLDWRYMTFWGMSGIVLGSLLPWIDGVCEGIFGQDVAVEESASEHSMGADAAGKESPSTDWALTIRGIGTFIGIAFAIRKLPWDSTLQLSLTLALVNPALWFLIDRSMTGFLVSSVVGLVGSGTLLGLSPELVPVPTAVHSSSASEAAAASSTSYGASYGLQNGSANGGASVPTILGGLASQETVATGIWMLNVLFCCCVCFGNIGRWLAVNRSAAGKGRWGWGERR